MGTSLAPPTHTPKSLWREEVEQVEELFQVVLERSSRKQQFVLQGVIIQHSEKLQHTQEESQHYNTNARSFIQAVYSQFQGQR